ncbi:hypothetical protein D3C73_1270860 [compost metagenome]
MNVALETRNIYDDFSIQQDILYFRVGDHGLVSFHGRNFNVKKRLSTDQMNQYMADSSFFKANTDCYVNLGKVESIQDGKVCFDLHDSNSKHVALTKLRESRLRELLTEAKSNS